MPNGSGATATAKTKVNGNAAVCKLPFLLTKTGEIKAELANALIALRSSPEFEIAFNDFKNEIIAHKVPWEHAGSTSRDRHWTDRDALLTTDWLQHHGVHVGVDVAARAIETVAGDNRFHPVLDYLNSLKWDRTKRIDNWLELYLGARASADYHDDALPSMKYVRAVGARWLISVIARVFQPGCKADCCPILEGPQGLGKSTALKILGEPFYTDDVSDFGTKDAVMQSRGVWIVEIAELKALGRAEISHIKAFMSRSVDRYRPPYGRYVVESPRECVFIGTSNQSEYLRDETGGRRFWPVWCEGYKGRVKFKELQRDHDQLWAEAVVRYGSGENWWLDTAELLLAAEEQQMGRYEGDPWDEFIADHLEKKNETSIQEILGVGCINLKPDAQKHEHRSRIVNLTSDFQIAGGEAIPPLSIAVRENYYRNRYGTVKAGKRNRVVPIPAPAVPMLAELARRGRFVGPDDAVFASRTGRPIDAHNTNKRIFKPIARAMGVTITWHIFRHSCATFAEVVGMAKSDRIALMGHATSVMTDHYTHSDVERRRASVDQIAGKLLPNWTAPGPGPTWKQ